jgi:uncharacterized protein involved in type VI secretion and phage assembly
MVARPVGAGAVTTPAPEFPATQYRETDLAFVRRRLAEEGLYFRFAKHIEYFVK